MPYKWLSIVAAVATGNNGIGYKGDLCYKIMADLRHFRRITLGHPVIMGSNTFRSLPKGALPGRLNIVISRDDPKKFKGCKVYSTLETALEELEKTKPDEAFIIGGERIYQQSIPYVSKLYITEIEGDPDADTYFPDYNNSEWREIKREQWVDNLDTELYYDFVEFERMSLL